MRHGARARALVAAAALGGMPVSGCGSDSAAERTLQVEPDALCPSLDAETGVWESTPWFSPDGSCPWVEYPGETALEVPHGLGRTPRLVLVYISFDPDGAAASLAAGDTGRVLEVTDLEVTVANATHQRFFARIVAE